MRYGWWSWIRADAGRCLKESVICAFAVTVRIFGSLAAGILCLLPFGGWDAAFNLEGHAICAWDA